MRSTISLFACSEPVPSRSCRVSFTDSEGLEHGVIVSAASVNEAAVLALAEFRRCGFAEVFFGLATRLTIRSRVSNYRWHGFGQLLR